MKSAFAVLILAAAVVAATPLAVPEPAQGSTKTLEARSTQICGQWDSVQTGGYTIYQDLWGESSGTGSQCTTVTGVSGGVLSWSTSWSWSGGSSSVKSYANAQINVTANGQRAISSIKSIPTKWTWSYTGSNIDGDVSYDMMFGNTFTASPSYELMVWLASYGGAGPISSTGSPVATPTIGGVSFKLYKGPNGSMTTFSFVATSTQENFSGDIMNFINYLVQNQGVPTSQILQSLGAGTEPFTGSNAVLTSQFSISID